MRGDFEILLFAFSALHESSGNSSICRVTGIDAAPQRQNSASWSTRGDRIWMFCPLILLGKIRAGWRRVADSQTKRHVANMEIF